MTRFFRTHPKIVRYFFLAYIVWMGCFAFPIRSERFPLDWSKLFLLISAYGIAALAFCGIYGQKQEKAIYLRVLPLTALGMLGRYLMEFGEHSNSYNFTPLNIISFLVIIPSVTTLSYRCFYRYEIEESEKERVD